MRAREPEPPELPLLGQWRAAFRLAYAWFQASGLCRKLGDEVKADEYLQHGLDILDMLEAKL